MWVKRNLNWYLQLKYDIKLVQILSILQNHSSIMNLQVTTFHDL